MTIYDFNQIKTNRIRKNNTKQHAVENTQLQTIQHTKQQQHIPHRDTIQHSTRHKSHNKTPTQYELNQFSKQHTTEHKIRQSNNKLLHSISNGDSIKSE